MRASLVIMAAGMGSRYGGNKQVDGIGPNNEILMEYSIYDAIRAGFNKVVFIIKPEMTERMDEICGNYLRKKKDKDGNPIEVAYCYQTFDSIPSYYKVPAERTKPFGTVHALLCAKDVVKEPFCVINADDYYGVDAFQKIHDELMTLPERGKGTMVGYLLKNTSTLNGTVSRGVCTVENGQLATIQEMLKIQLYADGSLKDLDTDTPLAPETVVSMNFWGFKESIFDDMQAYFDAFLHSLSAEELKKECLLPLYVGEELEKGNLTVSVLTSKDQWFGMTYREDKETVAKALQKLHENGIYPKNLRNN